MSDYSEQEELRQDLEMEYFKNLKKKIYDMFYNGCFLYYLNYDNFVDFINDITYKSVCLEEKKKYVDEFIKSHWNVFHETARIIRPRDINRYKEFVYDLSFKSCICSSLEESCKEYCKESCSSS
jgi:hypothetical protein